MKAVWDKYYAEYIQKHKSDGKDVFQLTNEAINYCMEKLTFSEERERDGEINNKKQHGSCSVQRTLLL